MGFDGGRGMSGTCPDPEHRKQFEDAYAAMIESRWKSELKQAADHYIEPSASVEWIPPTDELGWHAKVTYENGNEAHIWSFEDADLFDIDLLLHRERSIFPAVAALVDKRNDR